MRKSLPILMALAVFVLVTGTTLAFHDGGVADCAGCHTMHNSQDGELVDPDSPDGNPFLLVDSTPSDTCLGCHASRLGAVFTSDPAAPPTTYGGGNFVYLLETNINDGHAGSTNPILGESSGHSIISESKGVGKDSQFTLSPGGAFPAAVMACTSCHDGHGNANFRMLYGAGAVVQGGIATFANPAPTAEGLAIFGGAEAPDNHTAYQDNMSGWCGNCHGDFHTIGATFKHTTDTTIPGAMQTAYNLYNGTDDIQGGDAATAYLTEVPFEMATMTTDSTAGASDGATVMCMTCHRAHATSAPDAGRWDFAVTFLHEDGAESGSYKIPDPYASDNQRSLCNKCHVKDAGDAPFAP